MVGNGPNQEKQLYSAIKYLAIHVCARYLYAKQTGPISMFDVCLHIFA